MVVDRGILLSNPVSFPLAIVSIFAHTHQHLPGVMVADHAMPLAPAPPPLPPELWNLAVILTVCILAGWLARLLGLMLTVADLRYAVVTQAVLHLRDLGASLHVLRNASMWHFHQLLRTTTEAVPSKMSRIRIPFDVFSSSIAIKRSGRADGSTVLHFKLHSSAPCKVQVFWGVATNSLDKIAFDCGFALSSTRANSAASTVSPRQLIPPVLRQISFHGTVRALRTVPSRLGSRIRRQRRRHELRDDAITVNDSVSPVSVSQNHGDPPRSTPDTVAQSDLVEYDPSRVECNAISFPIPQAATACPEEEMRSLVEEVDTHTPVSVESRTSTAQLDQSGVPRFSGVIVLRPHISTNDVLKGGIFGTRPRRSSADVVCHCIAIDFLPTPLKPERFTPVIVKKTIYTRTASYTSQEIYGQSASSECAICLEGIVSVVLLPCRHFCVCRVCLQEIDRCPICRATFATYVGYDRGNRDAGVEVTAGSCND